MFCNIITKFVLQYYNKICLFVLQYWSVRIFLIFPANFLVQSLLQCDQMAELF